MLGLDQAVVLLLHGGLDNLSGKTGLSMLRHRSGPIVAVIDPAYAGCSVEKLTGIRRSVPVVADLEAALQFDPEVAVVGLAPSGGTLPDALRRDALAALKAGLNLASGLHVRLNDDPALREACWPDRWIWDLRVEPDGVSVARARAASLACQRVLTLGTDMAVGKMSACLEVLAAAKRQGRACRFVGTGQAGILISGQGIPLDAVRVDFAAGAVEQAVLAAARDFDPEGMLLIEGQGSFCHPGSTASLPLLRGTQPTAMLMVHRADQKNIDRLPEIPLPPLPELIQLCEAMASLARPANAGQSPRVKALALNTARLDRDAAERAIAEAQDLLGLPCVDPIRSGAELILEALWKG